MKPTYFLKVISTTDNGWKVVDLSRNAETVFKGEEAMAVTQVLQKINEQPGNVEVEEVP